MYIRGKIIFKFFLENEMEICRMECENEYLCWGFKFYNGMCCLSVSDLNLLILLFVKC